MGTCVSFKPPPLVHAPALGRRALSLGTRNEGPCSALLLRGWQARSWQQAGPLRAWSWGLCTGGQLPQPIESSPASIVWKSPEPPPPPAFSGPYNRLLVAFLNGLWSRDARQGWEASPSLEPCGALGGSAGSTSCLFKAVCLFSLLRRQSWFLVTIHGADREVACHRAADCLGLFCPWGCVL